MWEQYSIFSNRIRAQIIQKLVLLIMDMVKKEKMQDRFHSFHNLGSQLHVGAIGRVEFDAHENDLARSDVSYFIFSISN